MKKIILTLSLVGLTLLNSSCGSKGAKTEGSGTTTETSGDSESAASVDVNYLTGGNEKCWGRVGEVGPYETFCFNADGSVDTKGKKKDTFKIKGEMLVMNIGFDIDWKITKISDTEFKLALPANKEATYKAQ